MSGTTLSTHILDLRCGRPAAGVRVDLSAGDALEPLATGITDADGRIRNWNVDVTLEPGCYQLLFHTAAWYQAQSLDCFYPAIPVQFSVNAGQAHLHVPLLLNQYGYSTYRGS